MSQGAWDLGESIAGDEQTIGFQGRHADKLRINYKAEGDGFQCDALCDDGFTFTFRFRNEPSPKKYLDEGLSPLHARILGLFDDLKDKYHRVGMDNYFMSAKFCRRAYQHENKVLLQGVSRKGGRGFPSCAKQDEKSTAREEAAVRGTVKAAVLKGDQGCPGLVAASVYDTKPVHFLSMSCESIEWVKKERRVWDMERMEMCTMNFLRLNINDEYNTGMNDVDIADQKRNQYRFDIWLRNFKWWWSMWMWGVGLLKVNSFIAYVRFMETNGVPPSGILSHFDYQKSICLAYMDPDTFWPDYQASTVSSRTKKRRASSDDRSIASNSSSKTGRLSSAEGNKKKKWDRDVQGYCSRVDDKSLLVTGALKIRLDREKDHLPLPNDLKRARCALHRWCTGEEYCARLLKCPTCNVVLCQYCYRRFHYESDLVTKKGELKRKYERAKVKEKA